MGEKGLYGKKKWVYLEKTNGFLEEQMGDKVCDNASCWYRWSSWLLHGHKIPPKREFLVDLLWVSFLGVNSILKRDFMAASVPRSF